MDARTQFAQLGPALGPALGGVIGGIAQGQLDAPTPCADLYVRGVLEHLIGGATMFAAAVEPAPDATSTERLSASTGRPNQVRR